MERSVLARVAQTDALPQPLSDVAEIQGGIQKQPKRKPASNAYPFLRVANVTANGLDLTDVHQIELFGNELDRLRLERGDLLVVEGNGSPSQIGRAALWDGSIPNCVHQNHLIRVRPKKNLLPEFLEAVWNSPRNREELTRVASSTSGLYTLSVSKISSLPIPLPPIEEQRRRVAHVARVRDDRQRLEVEARAILARSARLRRALLAAAFSGQLTEHTNTVGEELVGG
jgi:type I restriction enzyme S subunit